MVGFFIGALCLVALIATSRGRRHGFAGWGGWRGRHHGHSHGDPGDFDSGGGDEGPAFGMRGHALRWLFRQLDTTPGQEKVIAQAFDDVRTELRSAKSEWKATKNDVTRAMAGEVFDANALDSVFTRHDDALVKVRTVVKTSLERVHEALTPKQREELAALLGKFKDRGFGPYRV